MQTVTSHLNDVVIRHVQCDDAI